MKLYSYVGQNLHECNGVWNTAAESHNFVTKWFELLSFHNPHNGVQLTNGLLIDDLGHALFVSNTCENEIWRQLRNWSRYDEIKVLIGFTTKDLPICNIFNREVLKKVALLLSMKCDVLSTVARRLLTK